jgi:hypothetical protein
MRLLLIARATLLTLTVLALTATGARAQETTPPRRDGTGAPAPEEPGPSVPLPTTPAAARPGHGSVEARVGYYHNDDSDESNPFLDEEETVIEPVLVFSYDATERLSFDATVSYDYVSSASIDRLSNFPDQSGASGDYYYGLDLGARFRATDDFRLGVTGGASFEYDYRSFRLGATAAWDLFEKNTTLQLGVNTFLDSVDVIRWNGAEDEGDEGRTTVSITAAWYQVLAPTVHMDLGYTFTHQDGFLETAYNSVVLEDASYAPNPLLENQARGIEVAEELPDTRIRHALYGEVRKYFDTGTAIGVGGRSYADSWGIFSQAVELRVYQWLVKDVLRVRARYRFYIQSAADDYDEHFVVPPGATAAFVATQDRTQDSDLGAFSSHTVGLRVDWQVVAAHHLDLSVDYVLRSDGLDQVLFGFGWRWEF